MRLLYFINDITLNGGIERIVIDKINFLAGLDSFHVSLAYYGTKHDIPFFAIDDRVSLIPMGEQSTGSSFILKICSYIRLSRKVKVIIDDVHPDVIVNANTILVSWLLPFIKRNIPKVVELHFSYEGLQIINGELYGKNWLKKDFNHLLRKWGYPKYDRCVLLTNDDLKAWRFKNAIVISNFTNIIPSECQYNSDSKTVVNMGRLAPQKNQKMLVEAWNRVYRQFPDWRLEIWGDGSLKTDLENQIQSAGLEHVVKLMGVSADVTEVYRRASFFVLSSRYEGQPLVMIEALQCGLPCVCTAVNGVKETIINGYNGCLVDEMTPAALAESIIGMIGSTCREEMSRNAIESSKRFDKEVVMKQWEDLFKMVAQQRGCS